MYFVFTYFNQIAKPPTYRQNDGWSCGFWSAVNIVLGIKYFSTEGDRKSYSFDDDLDSLISHLNLKKQKNVAPQILEIVPLVFKKEIQRILSSSSSEDIETRMNLCK